MNHIRKFKSFSQSKRRFDIIRESVLQVDDVYKVKSTIDIPQSLINAYVKKVKDNTGKNLRQFFGDMDIAEEIVKYLAQTGLDADKLSPTALVGGGQQQSQAQPQAQPQAQTQTQVQSEVQPQTQTQGEVQTESQPESETQGEVQAEAQPQTQGQGEFEEVQEESQGEEESEEEGAEELPD